LCPSPLSVPSETRSMLFGLSDTAPGPVPAARFPSTRPQPDQPEPPFQACHIAPSLPLANASRRFALHDEMAGRASVVKFDAGPTSVIEDHAVPFHERVWIEAS